MCQLPITEFIDVVQRAKEAEIEKITKQYIPHKQEKIKAVESISTSIFKSTMSKITLFASTIGPSITFIVDGIKTVWKFLQK